jgi:hypothetical protein
MDTWFDFRNGRVVAKNPDERALAKMITIARHLGARVRGDDGEFYDAKDAGGRPRSWWSRLFGRPSR